MTLGPRRERWRALARDGLVTACARLGLASVAFCCAVSCGEPEDDPEPDPIAFPASYADSYTEVRDCRQSGDHDLNNIRILTDSDALGPYQGRSKPFATASVVLKEEYEFDDVECSGAIKQWTVMAKLAPGTSPETLDWTWQRVDAERRLIGQDSQRCIACHTGCAGDPTGYDHTCADP